MKDIKIWIRTDDTPESVQDFALRLLQEDERYYGDFQIVMYNRGKGGTENLLSGIRCRECLVPIPGRFPPMP